MPTGRRRAITITLRPSFFRSPTRELSTCQHHTVENHHEPSPDADVIIAIPARNMPRRVRRLHSIMKEPSAMQLPSADGAVEPPRYRLRLYISGATPRSTQAIANIKALGEKRLAGRYDLEVIDAYQQAALTRDEQIVVLPTLIKSLPGPLRRMVGDLSDEEQVLLGLGLGIEETNANDGTGHA
jgi:circadian clock protein KaiB